MAAITADSPRTSGTCHHAEADLELLNDTQAYLRSLAAGEAPSPRLCGAWKRFYRMHASLVEGVVRGCRIPPEDAEDCVQEVWAEIVSRHAVADLQRRTSPINCRLVRLRWMEGRSVEEVAARLDLTLKQVYYRDHRVRKKLRRLLDVHRAQAGEIG